MVPKVRNLESLLRGGALKNSERITGTEVSMLTAPGENYGSVMIRILIKIKDSETNTDRVLDAVGKLVPESEKIMEVFNTPVTFRNEYKYYVEIVPLFDRFLKDNGIASGADFAAPFYGGRLTLNGNGHVDNDAIILMGNLVSSGYRIAAKKTEGLDFECTKVCLDSLAKFHAAGIVLKHRFPEIFEKHVKAYCYTFRPPPEITEMVNPKIRRVLEEAGFSKQEIETVQRVFHRDGSKININDEWGTLIQYDIWVNNILIKYENSKPIHSIMVDFQVFDYGTPLNDVTFFLLTSVEQTCFQTHFDDLLDYYHRSFCQNLRLLGMEMRAFSKANFDKQVAIAIRNNEYFHTIWMLEPIMNESYKSVDNLFNENDALMQVSQKYADKVTYITRMCLERRWL